MPGKSVEMSRTRFARWLRQLCVPALAAALFGLFWLGHIAGRWDILHPGRMGWLLVADWGAHQMGWMFFRNDPWSWPLGSYTSLLHPVGSTVGYSDSIPIMAIVCKLFSPVLPRDFQYIGPWLASCFMLQGYFGAKVTGLYWRDGWAKMAGGMLFVTTPTLLLRVGHPSLSAHWILIALLWLHLTLVPGRRALLWAALLTFLAAAIHPYLAAMTLVLALALFVRVKQVDEFFAWTEVGLGAVAVILIVAFEFWALGYFGTGARLEGDNYERYGADVTTLFNSMGYSRHLPGLPQGTGAYEGFAYLGGGLLLLTLAALLLVSPRELRRAHLAAIVPVGVACALLAVFALSPTVRFGGGEFIKLTGLYKDLLFVVHTFRSSGRFIWPALYLCITFAVGVLGTVMRNHPLGGRVVLGLALAVQVGDLRYKLSRDRFHASVFTSPSSPVWDLARGDYRHIAIYPPQIYTSGCGAPFDERYVYQLSHVAYRMGMTFNSGYMARLNLAAIKDHCRTFNENVAAGKLDDHTIYVPRSPESLPQGKAICGRLDDYVACVAPGRSTPFGKALSP
jgi:hypothetical protein